MNYIKKNREVAVILIIIVVIFFGFKMATKNNSISTVNLADKAIFVEIAQTNADKARGLIGHKPLNNFEGMLFVFDAKTNATFWMKDMSFPIDIIWIADNRVIGFIENALPDDGQELYHAPAPIDYVLEVQSGYVRNNNIIEGDYLELNID